MAAWRALPKARNLTKSCDTPKCCEMDHYHERTKEQINMEKAYNIFLNHPDPAHAAAVRALYLGNGPLAAYYVRDTGIGSTLTTEFKAAVQANLPQ